MRSSSLIARAKSGSHPGFKTPKKTEAVETLQAACMNSTPNPPSVGSSANPEPSSDTDKSRRTSAELSIVSPRELTQFSFASHLANVGIGIAQLASWVGDRISTLEHHYLTLEADAAEMAFGGASLMKNTN